MALTSDANKFLSPEGLRADIKQMLDKHAHDICHKRSWSEYLEALPSRDYVCDLQEQAKRCKTELGLIEAKIVKCQEKRSIKRKIERLKTGRGHKFIYVVNGAKASNVPNALQKCHLHRSRPLCQFDDIAAYSSGPATVKCTFIMQRNLQTLEAWQESLLQPSLPTINKVGKVKSGYTGVSLNGYAVDNKTDDWELRFDLDKTFTTKTREWKATPELGQSQWQYDNVHLFGRSETLEKMCKHVRHQAWYAKHTSAKECTLAAGECKHTQESWEQEQTLQDMVKQVNVLATFETVRSSSMSDMKLAETSLEQDMKVPAATRSKKDQDEEKDEDDEWKTWKIQSPPLITCMDDNPIEFDRVWFTTLDEQVYRSLLTHELLRLIARYKPTKERPFVVSVNSSEDYAHGGLKRYRMTYLIDEVFAHYHVFGPGPLHTFDLAASCYVRTTGTTDSPVLHTVFCIYVSTTEGLSVDAYNKIRQEHAKEEQVKNGTWTKWQADPTKAMSCVDKYSFKNTWMTELDRKEQEELCIQDVLKLIKTYRPTKERPFIVDTSYAEADGDSRLDYLVDILFNDYPHTGSACLHEHGLAATCYFRMWTNTLQPVFHLYESDEEGLPIWAYKRIRNECYRHVE